MSAGAMVVSREEVSPVNDEAAFPAWASPDWTLESRETLVASTDARPLFATTPAIWPPLAAPDVDEPRWEPWEVLLPSSTFVPVELVMSASAGRSTAPGRTSPRTSTAVTHVRLPARVDRIDAPRS